MTLRTYRLYFTKLQNLLLIFVVVVDRIVLMSDSYIRVMVDLTVFVFFVFADGPCLLAEVAQKTPRGL